MMKRLSLTFLFFLSTLAIWASDAAFPADSIRVKWMDGKKYILHKVELKETWMSISKLYNCTVDQLQGSNKGVTDLKTGQIIHVPVVNPAETGAKLPAGQESSPSVSPSRNSENQAAGSSGTDQKVYYTVKKGETLYSIAKKHQLTVAEIKAMNNLAQDVVNEGQQLVVGVKPAPARQPAPVKPVITEPEPAAPSKNKPEHSRESNKNEIADISTASASKTAPVPVNPVKKPAVTGAVSELEKPTKSVSPVKKSGSGKTLMQVTETGVASWIQDGQLNQNKYYALHRTAPIGTIIKVTNRMNNQFVYVKVVGLLPDTGENDNVILKVSQAVTGKLNALDPLFQVELNYGLLQ